MRGKDEMTRIQAFGSPSSAEMPRAAIIRSEKQSGTTTNGRTELQTVLDFLRKGDTLMVTRIDRERHGRITVSGLDLRGMLWMARSG